MKYWSRTKHYIVEKDEYLILHPMLSNKKIRNPFKHYEVRKKYYLILNEPLPRRKNFGKKKVKSPQTQAQYEKLLRENFPVVKNIDLNLKQYLTNKEYRQNYKKNKDYIAAETYTSTKKIVNKSKKIRNFAKVVIGNAAILSAIYFGANYGPGLYNSAKNYIIARLRPESVEAPEFNPNNEIKDDKINADIGNTKDEDKKVVEIKIDKDGMVSYELLKESNISKTLQLYLGDEREVIPMFVYQNETSDGLKTLNLFCKLGDDEIVKLEYDIDGPLQDYYYNKLFYSTSITPSDLINTLSNLASDEYLTDMPITSKIISLDGSICSSVSDLYEDIKYDTIDGEFVEKEIYSFKIVSLQDNGEIVEKHYEISKEDAQNLEDFNEENIGSLLTAFKKDASKFDLTATFNMGYNAPTLVLINAEKQAKESQEQIKFPNDYNDDLTDDSELTL